MMLVSQLVRDDVAHDLTMEESKHAVDNLSSIELGIKKNALNKLCQSNKNILPNARKLSSICKSGKILF